MSREAIPTWSFAMVVARLGRRFLVVRERKHGQLWYLPAGRVEPGESFARAAVRETLEEAGVPVTLEGVLRVEHSPSRDGSGRMRVFFAARPSDDTPPKTVPDEHSLEARWVTMEELAALPLRGEEVRAVFAYVLGGGAVHPLSLLTDEGARWLAG
jgi:ADP-ribose pyrophosphatase YjhB (NUDIX family)